jgi:hypothetical protein
MIEADLFPPIQGCEPSRLAELPQAGKVLFRVGFASMDQIEKMVECGRLKRETDVDDVSDVMLGRFNLAG